MLEGFQRALQIYFVQAKTCKWEPRWSELYPHVARPEHSAEKKRAAAEHLAGLEVTCGKLKLRPDACHGCPDNPLGSTQKEADQQVFDRYRVDIAHIHNLHDALGLGVRGNYSISDVEFQMLRAFWWKLDSQRRSSLF